MDVTNLIETLSQYGQVEICKADYVFTLLLIGTNLTNMRVMGEIQMKVSDFTKEKYPIVETIRNSEEYVCMVLKPE